MRLSDFQGKPMLLFFGYTNCPDVCPMTLTEWKKVRDDLGDRAQNVGFVFISVDSQRDRPAVLAKFTAKYDPLFIGMTADASTLRLIGPDYGLYWTPHQTNAAPNAPDVDHSPASYLIDPQSRLVKIYTYGVPATTISADIKKMLQ
jgi:protein SCO1/2